MRLLVFGSRTWNDRRTMEAVLVGLLGRHPVLGAQEPEAIEAHLALLRPMLDAYPEIPPGFNGWWVYKR